MIVKTLRSSFHRISRKIFQNLKKCNLSTFKAQCLKEGIKYMTWMKIILFLGINFTLESKGVYQVFAWEITEIYGEFKVLIGKMPEELQMIGKYRILKRSKIKHDKQSTVIPLLFGCQDDQGQYA